MPQWVELLFTKQACPRRLRATLLIHHFLNRPDFDPTAMVGFPDDDAWYPEGALACVARHFGDPSFSSCSRAMVQSPSADGCDEAFRPTLQQALSHGACAGNLRSRSACWHKLGGFHELLGLGTELRGGEDTEFVHRAFHRATPHIFAFLAFLSAMRRPIRRRRPPITRAA